MLVAITLLVFLFHHTRNSMELVISISKLSNLLMMLTIYQSFLFWRTYIKYKLCSCIRMMNSVCATMFGFAIIFEMLDPTQTRIQFGWLCLDYIQIQFVAFETCIFLFSLEQKWWVAWPWFALSLIGLRGGKGRGRNFPIQITKNWRGVEGRGFPLFTLISFHFPSWYPSSHTPHKHRFP